MVMRVPLEDLNQMGEGFRINKKGLESNFNNLSGKKVFHSTGFPGFQTMLKEMKGAPTNEEKHSLEQYKFAFK